MKVKGKVLVVTGGGSGMGRELTLQLVKKGAKVAIADINAESMAETAALAGIVNVSTHVLNVANRAAVEAFPDTVIKYHGTVDGIINNAGIIQPFIHVNELDYDQIERVMNINFYGTVYMTKSFLPHLLKRPEAHIANVSSMGGFIPFPSQTFYGASKAAVKLLTEGLYAELKNTNVGVTVIHPGAVNTNIMSNSSVRSALEVAEMKKGQPNIAISAAKAASIMIDAIEKNKFRVLVGNDVRFLDFLYRLAPKTAVNIITKQMSKLKL
jgi:NAD(P)-dependent dehydrogenase (short-subunit alcohol dehydrogenase family)